MSTHILRLCLVVSSDDNCLISDFKILLAFIYLYTVKYILKLEIISLLFLQWQHFFNFNKETAKC